MTEAVQLALIKEIPEMVMGASTTAIAYLSYRTHALAKETKAVAKQTEENTNHLKDELVAAVRQVAFTAGQKDQKDNPA